MDRLLSLPLQELILLFLFVIAVPVYILVLITVVRFRNVEPFNSTYFTLVIAAGAVDIWALLHRLVLLKFPSWGIGVETIFFPLCSKEGMIRKENGKLVVGGFLPTYAFVVHIMVSEAQLMATLCMAHNRYTALAKPFAYTTVWSVGRTKIAIGIVSLLAILITSPFWFSDIKFAKYVGAGNITAMVHVVEIRDQVTHGGAGYGTVLLICTVGSSVLYGASFYKMWKHSQTLSKSKKQQSKASKNKETGQNRPKQNNPEPAFYTKTEFKLAMCGLTTLLIQLTLLVMNAVGVLSFNDTQFQYFLMRVTFVVIDVFGWHNPFVLIGMSQNVRQAFIKTVAGCKSM